MFSRIIGGLMCLVLLAPPAQAQTEPVDTLVSRFIDRGVLLWWKPSELFRGCPRLEQWQEKGISQLLSTDLSLERINDLARSWAAPLKTCNDPRLDDWFIGQMDAAIERGEWGRIDAVRGAIYRAGTPPMQTYLRAQMLDESKPERVRNSAGGFYFENLPPETFMNEFLRAFLTMRLPTQVAWFQAGRLVEQDPERLMREVGRLVGTNIELAEQIAFTQILETSTRRASRADRLRLADDLEKGLTDSAGRMPVARASELRAAAQVLRKE